MQPSPSPAEIEDAARTLREGRLVAFPTETVYGLGADATNGRAVAEVYAAKGRPAFNPLIVHVAAAEDAFGLGVFPEPARPWMITGRSRLRVMSAYCSGVSIAARLGRPERLEGGFGPVS